MRTEDILSKARQVRELEHRLRPALRLRTLEEIQEFIHQKGIVSIFGGNELPSVISAILGREWKPTRKGFTSWGDWWSIKISGQNAGRALGQLERMKDTLSTRIFRHSKTLVSNRLWPILDPIVKHHLDLASRHEILSELERRILELLDTKGPTRTDHLRSQLRLEGKKFTSSFHRSLSQLEGYGLILGYEDPKPERHLHANIWQVWDERVHVKKTGSSYEEALMQVMERTIDACVLAPVGQIGKWFQWNDNLAKRIGDLVRNDKVLEVDGFFVAARVGTL